MTFLPFILMCTFQVLLLFWGPKDFCVKNMIFVKEFTESVESGTFSIVPDFSKLEIENKASFWSPQNQLMRTMNAFCFWKLYQNVKKGGLLSKLVNDNVTLFTKGLNYQKDWVICWKNQYIIYYRVYNIQRSSSNPTVTSLR